MQEMLKSIKKLTDTVEGVSSQMSRLLLENVLLRQEITLLATEKTEQQEEQVKH